jgi:FkbM family methyltransferase
MSRSATIAGLARKYPSIFRTILNFSVAGYLPPIHRHWFFRSLARDLFETKGFPVWGTPYRLHIPRALFPVYFDYFNFLDHEPLTRRIFAKLLKPGYVVIDVGANVGYFTLIAAAKVGPRGKVHSVECSSETLAILRENIRQNQLQNVEVHPIAASNERGELKLNISAIGLSWFSLHENWPQITGSGSIATVPAVPLDEIVHSRVDVVKIDAEGADLDVLKGMRRILSENSGIALIVEWAPMMLKADGKDPLELPRWLKHEGFTDILVLEESTNRFLPLNAATDRLNAGVLPDGWVGDLVARRTPLRA